MIELVDQLGEPALARLDFDQYYRYGAVGLLLKPLLAECERPVRILEVGCNVLSLLPEFLQPCQLELTRCDVEDFGGDDPAFVVILGEGPLPFADGQFDFVVALEVLEHIPAENRLFCLSEWARIAERGVVLSCPNGVEAVKHAETRARRAYQARHGRPHPWLAEHAEFGLPRPETVAGLLDELGLQHFRFTNCPLAEWLPLLLLTEELTETASPAIVPRFNELIHQRPFRLFTRETPYRQIFVGFKRADDALHAARLWQATLDGRDERTIDPVLVLTRSLQQALQKHVIGWEQEEEYRRLRGQLLATQRALTEQQVHSAELDRLLRVQRLKLEALPSEKSGERLPQASLRFAKLHQLRQPAETLGYWESLGDDPQIHLDIALPPGWCELRVAGQLPAGTVSKLYYDDGSGFREDRCLLLGPWRGPEQFARLHCFHQPVRAVRFDPLDAPGPFRLDELEVRPVGKLGVAWHALGIHLREWLHPRHWLAKPLKLAALLLRQGPGGLRAALASRLQPKSDACQQVLDPPPDYGTWSRAHAVTHSERAELVQRLAAVKAPPRLSVALALPRFDEGSMRRTLGSLARQHYEHVTLHIAVAPVDAPALQQILKDFPALERRFLAVEMPPPCRASDLLNRLVERGEGDFVVPIDPGDQLADDAFLVLADAIAREPGADLYYSDEDHWRPGEGRLAPHCKPDWSPETFLAQPYTGRLAAYARARCCERGGFQPGFEGAHEFELILRLMASECFRVVHVPRVLNTRQGFPPRPYTLPEPCLRVLRHHAERLGLDLARTNSGHGPRFHTCSMDLVSIVIPSAGRATAIRGRATYFVQQCVESIRRLTTYPRYEITVVDNGDLAPELLVELDALGVHRVTFREPFNLAAKLNLGARHARGEYLVLLNDDTEVISPDWLESMLEYAARPGIGVVGAKLYFPDGRLQHVGVLLLDGNPSHSWYAAPGSHEGYLRSSVFPRNYLAVTGACLMTRRDVFERVGGFDPQFPLNYNDVDFCLRVRDLGLRCVWTPHAELYHHEAVSKEGGASVQPWELERFKARWGKRYPVDPYYSPNLSPRHCDYRLRAIRAKAEVWQGC